MCGRFGRFIPNRHRRRRFRYRQLKSARCAATIERAFILADDIIKEEHLIFDTPPLETGTTMEEMIPAGVPLEEIEKAAIINTLEENLGNKTETAQDLGISVKTLYNKLDKYHE